MGEKGEGGMVLREVLRRRWALRESWERIGMGGVGMGDEASGLVYGDVTRDGLLSPFGNHAESWILEIRVLILWASKDMDAY